MAWWRRLLARFTGIRDDHLVEVYQVNTAPGEEAIDRFMYAQCAEDGCDFLEFADRDADDEEANLRTKINGHSKRQSPLIQIYI